MTRNSEINMATNLKKTVNPQIKAMINSDQLAVTEVLQDDHSHCETEWRPEEDLSDDGASEMSPENRELWDYFLNNSDPYSPLCFSCTDEVNALDNYHCDDDELVPCNHQETETKWSEEKDTDWLDKDYSEVSSQTRELWDSFLNNSDPYSPLCFSCPVEVKASNSVHYDDDELFPSNLQETKTEWSEEEDSDWSDDYSEMSSKIRELWDSLLNISGPYSPLCFSCPAEVNASGNDHCDDDELVSCDSQETETEWSEEEYSDWTDKGYSEMSPENRELWDYYLNNSDPYSPLCFSWPAEVKALDSVHCDDDVLVPSNLQETKTEWSEEEDNDWSDEDYSEMSSKIRELWDSLLNISGPYSPLCFSCPAKVKALDSVHCDDDDDDDECVPFNLQETKTEWSEEEDNDWSDEDYSEMSPKNRELWDSFLNNSDPYSPLCFSCPAEVKASDSDHCDDEEFVSCDSQETETERSEEKDTDWSDEGDSEMSPENSRLWDSFINNSDPYCPAGLKIKASEVKQNHTPSSPTAREVEEHNPDQNTKKSAKKVHFSEEVTIHTLEAWGFASQAARDGSCWMKMAIDRLRFKRRVEKAGEFISPCLTAQHRDRVLDRLRSHSDGILDCDCG
ncbi:hypothetical protein Q7C36_004712 [Tachysurus vachellii]|uniref:Protein DP71L n=1 Tax=Tachysurus vachellii TaxID=175792 RepID=A0AA88NKD8_TACVA|nr:hypothetical protein Q7C36_004712 [Tachysurus vachellii]